MSLRRLSSLPRGVPLPAAVLFLSLAGVGPLAAQTPAGGRADLFVGSGEENYLRYLQSTGEVGAYPWTIRGFSPEEADRLAPVDSLHPWARRFDFGPDSVRGLHTRAVSTAIGATFNSAFPYGFNDGPLWAGRGLTLAAQGGVAARYGPLSLVLDPMVFWAQNARFDLMPNGQTGKLQYADGVSPTTIDLPQRFGDGSYARVDPGQSTLRLDLRGVAVGASTADQQWGPATDFPIILGNNAPGFPHVFLGTSHPINIWIGRVHGRVVWGRLAQSDYSVAQGAVARRLMTGAVGIFLPRGVPGLELGAARFFHSPWPEGGLDLDHLLKPFEGVLKKSLNGVGTGRDPYSDIDNQLASVFFRWVLAPSGFEVYGEYAREDHNWDLRDFLLEPDHDSGYMLGFRKAWAREDASLFALRGEVLNTRITHLQRVRPQTPFYRHTGMVQGHTERGQILGAAPGYGGGGAVLAADWYRPAGRWSLSLTRMLRGEMGTYWKDEILQPKGIDVTYGLKAETVRFRGPLEITGSLTAVEELNRYFSDDAFNLNAALGVRWSY